MADKTKTPSNPKFIRPDFSVMHSPRLTNRNGVPTRMAPPNTAQNKNCNVCESITSLQEDDALIENSKFEPIELALAQTQQPI